MICYYTFLEYYHSSLRHNQFLSFSKHVCCVTARSVDLCHCQHFKMMRNSQVKKEEYLNPTEFKSLRPNSFHVCMPCCGFVCTCKEHTRLLYTGLHTRLLLSLYTQLHDQKHHSLYTEENGLKTPLTTLLTTLLTFGVYGVYPNPRIIH
jgi:hypothetical protein